MAAGCGSILGIDDGKPLPDGSAETGFPGDDAPGDDATGDDGPASDAPADGRDAAKDAGPDGTTDGGTCALGSTGCMGNQSVYCVNGVWKPVGSACTGATPACMGGMCVECNPPAKQCMGQQPQVCGGNGTWQSVGSACSGQACVAGTCTGTCMPGATQCDSTNAGVETCNQMGNWGTSMSCAPTACVNGACGACVQGKATAWQRATRPGIGAPRPSASPKRASAARARECARPTRRSARATLLRPAAPPATG